MVRLRWNIVVGGRLYSAGSIVDEEKELFSFVRVNPLLIAEELERPGTIAEEEPTLPLKKIMVHKPPPKGLGAKRPKAGKSF